MFAAISTVDVDTILSCSDAELRPVLSCLVRMSLIAPMDQSQACLQGRTVVLQVCIFSKPKYLSTSILTIFLLCPGGKGEPHSSCGPEPGLPPGQDCCTPGMHNQ